jgi:proteasome lid subunit RPN8/RPN11
MSAPALRLPRDLLAAMEEQGRREAPLEACGYCAGTDGEVRDVREVLPLRNVDQSAEHFSFDPKDQFAALRAARDRGLGLVAVYHTHPATPARMSAEDIRLANDPHMLYLILSLATGQLKGFVVDQDKRVAEVGIEIAP